MAESSIFWTTNATGDGIDTGYTMAQAIECWRDTFVNAPTTQGVILGVGNALIPAGTSSPVTINTGAAWVYGFFYTNGASVNVAVGTPAIGTTGHRIVLRASWAAQTVRITLISSADGVAAIPAVTQVANTTWDVTLATLTITTGGVITLTDARVYAHTNLMVGTAQIDDGAITTAKILNGTIATADIAANAIDDTLAGDRVPQLYRRQGGSATDWDNPGTTTRTPTAVRMQCGSGTTAANGYLTVTFPTAFSAIPMGLVTTLTHTYYGSINTIAADTMQVYTCTDAGTAGASVFHWLAIGPE